MSSPDHGSTVTPLKSAAWEQVKAMRAAAEDQGDDYPPPPGARIREARLSQKGLCRCARAAGRHICTRPAWVAAELQEPPAWL